MSMQVPESMKSTWDNIAQKNTTGKLTQEEYTALGNAANADGQIDDSEKAFLNFVETTYLNSSSDVKQGSANPVNFVDNQSLTSFDINLAEVPQTMLPTWNSVTSKGTLDNNGFEQLKSAAAPNKVNSEFDDSELSFLGGLLKALEENNGLIGINNVSGGNPSQQNETGVPESLKAVWTEISAKGSVTEEDMTKLVSTAAPNGLDEELDEAEFAFLSKVREILNNGGGIANIAGGTDAPVSANTSGPVLLQWTGYTNENKAALKNAFDGMVTGTKMPILQKQYALQVAEAFGQTSVQDLQRMVGAKVDGVFGPETFFKAKAFIATVMNKTDDPNVLGQLSGMLNALGNDKEVSMMKQKLSGASSNTPPQNNTGEVKAEETKTENVSVNLQTVDVNNKEAVAAFQSKLNILTSILEKETGQELPKSPEDGNISGGFATTLSNFETVTGKSAEAIISDLDSKMKDTPFKQLDARSAKFVHFQSTGFEVISNPVNLTRIESSKTLLEKLGITLGSYDIQYPQNPLKDGDVVLVGKDFNLKIWDNFQSSRGHDTHGDIHIEGDITGKKVDVAYWENSRRGPEPVNKEGLYHIRFKVDGQEQHFRDNEKGFLPKPLAR